MTESIGESSLLTKKPEFELGGKLYRIIPKRWGILVIVSTILLLDTFSASFFGFINDMSAVYFRQTPAVIDLLSTVNMIARSVFGFVLAMAGEKLNFRRLTLITTSTIVAGDLLITAGVSSRGNFAVCVMGQILNGFGATMALTVTQMAPSNWFPAYERGRAVSLPWVTRRLSPVVSNLVATRAIQVMPPQLGLNATSSDVIELEMVADFQVSFQLAYIGIACVALLAYLFSYKYVTDYPPRVSDRPDSPEVVKSWNPLTELRGILKLFSNGQYVLLFTMYVLVLSVRPLTEWLISSVVLAAFPELNDRIAGTMFCVGYSIGAMGPPAGGAILDKFKRPKLTFLVGALFEIICCGILALAICIHSFPLLFAAYIGTTFFRDFSFVCISHAFVETMNSYSNSVKVRAFSISGSVPWFSLAAYTAVFRIILDQIGAEWAVVFPIPFYLLSIPLYLCLYKPPKHQLSED